MSWRWNRSGEFGKLCGPGQFLQNAAQEEEAIDIGDGRQGRRLRAQVSHPAEDVRIAAQLLQRMHLGMFGAEIRSGSCGRCRGSDEPSPEVSAAVSDSTARSNEGPSGCWSGGLARAIHDGITGSGRMCWATARAYCW